MKGRGEHGLQDCGKPREIMRGERRNRETVHRHQETTDYGKRPSSDKREKGRNVNSSGAVEEKGKRLTKGKERAKDGCGRAGGKDWTDGR